MEHPFLMFLDHTRRRSSRQDSSGRVISSSQRPLPDNTRQSQQTNIHAPGGIRTQDLSRRAAEESYRLCCVVVCDLETSRMGAPYIYDNSSRRVNDLTLILLTWRKWCAPNNASRQQMGFNSGFKGLKTAFNKLLIRE